MPIAQGATAKVPAECREGHANMAIELPVWLVKCLEALPAFQSTVHEISGWRTVQMWRLTRLLQRFILFGKWEWPRDWHIILWECCSCLLTPPPQIVDSKLETPDSFIHYWPAGNWNISGVHFWKSMPVKTNLCPIISFVGLVEKNHWRWTRL